MSSIADPSVDEAAIGAINDAAGYCRTLWATFIGYAATIFVLTSGTTHEALLRRTPVKLPLFNVDSGIPLLLFYVIAPLLLVLFHLNLLMKLHDLRVRVSELILPLNYCDDANAQFERNRLRRRLMAFDYAMLKAGLVTDRRERWLLALVSDSTIFFMPVLLLLFVQLQFLPYHDGKITWLQRGFVIADLGLIAYIQLWLRAKRAPAATQAAGAMAGWTSRLRLHRMAMSALFVLPLLVSTIVLAFPGEPQDVFWRTLWSMTHSQTQAFWPLAGTDFAEKFGIRRSLNLADRTLWAELPSEELLQALNQDTIVIALRDDIEGVSPEMQRTVERIRNAALSLRGRNLSYANFENATLIAADFRPDLSNNQLRDLSVARTAGEDSNELGMLPASTDITGASFSGANLRGARFPYVLADDAEFSAANLQSAVLAFAQLRNADFYQARLQNASLESAQLQGATMAEAQLQSTDLKHAHVTIDQLMVAHWEDAELDFDIAEQLKTPFPRTGDHEGQPK
jgi:uncharacterized protein YjbI with pentapeptide repeats